MAMSSHRTPLLMAMMFTAAVTVSTDRAEAQKFLQYGRLICPGNVAIGAADNQQRPIRRNQNVFVRVPSVLIAWFCDGQPQSAYACPTNTNIVQIDRRQTGPVFTITCLQR